MSAKPCDCGAMCVREPYQAAGEPCWGTVRAVDEQTLDDGDFQWVHACPGHADVVTDGGPYVPARQERPTTGSASMLDQCIKIAGKVHRGIGDAAVSAQVRGELRANMEVQLDMLRELAKRLGGL